MNIKVSGWSPWTSTNRSLHGWEEGSHSGSPGKLNELKHDTEALAFVWLAAHHSPKLLCNSQAVSTQTDNGSISSWKLSTMTTVLHSRGGAAAHMTVCLQMVCMWGVNATRRLNTIGSKQTHHQLRQKFSQCHILSLSVSLSHQAQFTLKCFYWTASHEEQSTIKEKKWSKSKHCSTF